MLTPRHEHSHTRETQTHEPTPPRVPPQAIPGATIQTSMGGSKTNKFMTPFQIGSTFHPERLHGNTKISIDNAEFDVRFEDSFLATNCIHKRCLLIIPGSALWTSANGCACPVGDNPPSKAQKLAKGARRDANAREEFDF